MISMHYPVRRWCR